jgi:hypothetical protein
MHLTGHAVYGTWKVPDYQQHYPYCSPHSLFFTSSKSLLLSYGNADCSRRYGYIGTSKTIRIDQSRIPFVQCYFIYISMLLYVQLNAR